MTAIASQITSLTIVYSTVYSGSDQRKHQSSASLAFVWGIHRWPVNSPHKGPVTRKKFPFDDVIMRRLIIWPSVSILLIGPLGTNLSQIRIIRQFSIFKNMHFNKSSATLWLICSHLNLLNKASFSAYFAARCLPQRLVFVDLAHSAIIFFQLFIGLALAYCDWLPGPN